MTFEQKIRKALPHLSARELWFIEVDYTVSAITMAHLKQRAEERRCERMRQAIITERLNRFLGVPCPFPHALTHWLKPRESKELDALYKRIQRGASAAPKLKKIEAGEYIYDGRYYITDIGYDRIHGHRIWSVTDKDDKNCKRIAHSETLRGAVQLLRKFLSGEKVVAQ